MNRIRRLAQVAVSLIAFPLALACGGSTNHDGSTAGNAAIEVTALKTGGFDYTQGTYLLGFEFKANSEIQVTDLGYYDSNLEGSSSETFEATPVGLYDLSTGTLLGSVTVSASDPSHGFYRYHSLASPIALNTSDSYAAVAVTGTNYYVAGEGASCVGGFACSNATANSAITITGGACLGSSCLTETSTLSEPNDSESWINLSANFLISE